MSKYLKAFQAVAESPDFTLVNPCLLVELIQDEEFKKTIKTDDGRMVSLTLTDAVGARQVGSIQADKPMFARVLLAGEGYYDDADPDKTIPLDVEAGDIILAGAHAFKVFSVFGKIVSYGETKLALVMADQIQMRFHGQEGFDNFFGRINRSLEAAMETDGNQ